VNPKLVLLGSLACGGCSSLEADCAEARCWDPTLPPRPAVVAWTVVVGGAGDQALADAAFDGDGNVIVSGRFGEEARVGEGGPVLEGAGAEDALVAKLAPSGAVDWAFGFGDVASQPAPQLAVDGGGAVYLSGELAGTITFDIPLTAEGATDAYVARLDPQGDPVWSRVITVHSGVVQGTKLPLDLAVGDDVVVVGAYTGDFGGCAPCPQVDGEAAFLQRWSRGGDRLDDPPVIFDTPGSERLAAAAWTGDTVVVGGAFEDELALGAHTVDAAGPGKGLLATIGPRPSTPTVGWARALDDGGPGVQAVRDVAVSGATIVVAGSFGAQAHFHEPAEPVGNNDAFLLGLDATGASQWDLVAGSSAFDEIAALAVDAGGRVVFAGRSSGRLAIGGTELEPGGDVLFVGAVGAEGTLAWVERVGEAPTLRVEGLAVHASGRIAVAGTFAGALVIGDATLQSFDDDGFVVVLDPG
jgi:hypothetical protein